MEIFNPPAIYGEAQAGRAAEVRRKLKDMGALLSQNTFDLAELFFEAQDNAYYLQWGYESLGQFAQEELGIKERKAQYLARIVKICKDVGIKRENYEPAGISKLREITSLDPDGFWFDGENNHALDELIVDLILDAPDLSITQIKDKVAALKGQVGEDRMVPRMFSVTESCWNNTIAKALELAAKNMGSAGRDSDGTALEYSMGAKLEAICINYLQDPNNHIEETDDSGNDGEEMQSQPSI